ncbi:MAG: hypothetical protein WC364_12385 [Eubacteriales bacterium]|jgi:death-on-curing protein
MKRLSVPQIVLMHSILIKETGGMDGIRDENLLDSAINAPFQTYGGEYLYKSQAASKMITHYSVIYHLLIKRIDKKNFIGGWF